jgi:hypothetical protein
VRVTVCHAGWMEVLLLMMVRNVTPSQPDAEPPPEKPADTSAPAPELRFPGPVPPEPWPVPEPYSWK